MTAPDLVALVVETSRTVDLCDAERARDGARLLERTGTAALPVVAGRFIGEGAELMRVWRVIDSRTHSAAHRRGGLTDRTGRVQVTLRRAGRYHQPSARA